MQTLTWGLKQENSRGKLSSSLLFGMPLNLLSKTQSSGKSSLKQITPLKPFLGGRCPLNAWYLQAVERDPKLWKTVPEKNRSVTLVPPKHPKTLPMRTHRDSTSEPLKNNLFWKFASIQTTQYHWFVVYGQTKHPRFNSLWGSFHHRKTPKLWALAFWS